VSTVFAKIEFSGMNGRIEVCLFECPGSHHCVELFNDAADWTLKVDLTGLTDRIIVDPGGVDYVVQALLNCASTVKMMLVAPLLVPVL
jgi:hypothetical protein